MSEVSGAKYRVINLTDKDTFEHQVTLHLNAGWIPAGGVTFNPQGATYMQAVYRPGFYKE